MTLFLSMERLFDYILLILYSKKIVVRVAFGDRVDVRNDFLYNMEGVRR